LRADVEKWAGLRIGIEKRLEIGFSEPLIRISTGCKSLDVYRHLAKLAAASILRKLAGDLNQKLHTNDIRSLSFRRCCGDKLKNQFTFLDQSQFLAGQMLNGRGIVAKLVNLLIELLIILIQDDVFSAELLMFQMQLPQMQ
jgi:hypothetical protein